MSVGSVKGHLHLNRGNWARVCRREGKSQQAEDEDAVYGIWLNGFAVHCELHCLKSDEGGHWWQLHFHLWMRHFH